MKVMSIYSQFKKKRTVMGLFFFLSRVTRNKIKEHSLQKKKKRNCQACLGHVWLFQGVKKYTPGQQLI